MKVIVIGAGQVGRALASAFRKNKIAYRLVPYRNGIPARIAKADLLLLCTRDGQLAEAAATLAQSKLPPGLIVAHLAGALSPDVLSPLKPYCRGIAQMHPYCSILSTGQAGAFRDVPFLVTGDRAAVLCVRQLLRALKARAFVVNQVERATYHLSAALLANGAVALLSKADQLLEASGIPARARPLMLGSLLDSVRANVAKLGPTRALTGPVRRGDVATLKRHLSLLKTTTKDATLPLYQGLVLAQLDLVRQLGELTVTQQRQLRALVR